MERDSSRGHGWWPYLGPYIAFMLAGEVGVRLPEQWAPALLFIKPMAPLGLILYFWRKGAYPELRGSGLTLPGACQDILVGLVLTAVWVLPYLVFDGMRLEDPATGGFLPDSLRADTLSPFDPFILGTGGLWVVLGARMFGYALVTPLFEELFIRSFVMRYSEVYSSRGDFRDVPLAHFGWTSFIVTTVIFTLGHVPWEYWVAIPWVVLTNLWFYYRKDLYAVILVRATTNAAILLFVAWADGLLFDGQGGLGLSLWFFV